MFGCVNLDNGQIKISKVLQPSTTLVTADTEVSDGTKVCGAANLCAIRDLCVCGDKSCAWLEDLGNFDLTIV